MSLSVLFVDDEPNVLDGLRRSLRGFRREWDMRFAPGGAAALAILGEAQADVVVSDMRMPGMNGDELLAEVRRRHPQTVRIVLTGECAREAMTRVTTLAHRVLTKPCDPDELRSAIQQAFALQGLLLGPHLGAVVGRLPGWGNAWVATGHGANGLLQGPYSARVLAHEMAGVAQPGDEAPLPGSFDPGRFA